MFRNLTTFVTLWILACSPGLLAQKSSPATATALNAGDCVAIVHVTDSHGAKIAGARVVLSGSSAANKFQLTEISDADGSVRFAGLPRARLRLSVTAHEKQVKQSIDVADGCVSNFGIEMPD